MEDLNASFIDNDSIVGFLDDLGGSINGELNGDSEWDVGGQLVTPTVVSYEELINKPKIEGNVLLGDKTFEELSLLRLTNQEIENILIV